MDTNLLLNRLKAFDPELSDLLLSAVDRQINTLSLIPTANAVSPFSAYLKGSVLGNDFLDHHAMDHYSHLEKMAVRRVKQLFNAEHAIVRVGNPVAASRVIFYALAKSGDKIMSFNLRKQEICSGDWMNYEFIKFGLEPETLAIDFEKTAELARRHKPRLLIYSPVNYPRNIEYQKLRKIADEAGAYLWVDLGQNAGLIAAGLAPSPVPYADVMTFAASDALHGPQNGIILCTEKLVESLDKAVIDTGHVSLKKNVLAALAIAFKEATADEYHDYCEQTITNAKALEEGLHEAGVETLCGPTQNHLVLAKLGEGQEGEAISAELAEAGLMVKAEHLMTTSEKSLPVLRLSSLDPTTRSLKEKDMQRVGRKLGGYLRSGRDKQAREEVANMVNKVVAGQPLFSEEWLPDAEANTRGDRDVLSKMLMFWNT